MSGETKKSKDPTSVLSLGVLLEGQTFGRERQADMGIPTPREATVKAEENIDIIKIKTKKLIAICGDMEQKSLDATVDFLHSRRVLSFDRNQLLEMVLACYFIKQSFPSRAILLRQGEAADFVFFIQRGSVEVKVTKGRKLPKLVHRVQSGEVVLTSLAEGESVGVMSVIFDIPQPATIQCISDVTAICMSKEDFLTCLKGTRSFSVSLESMVSILNHL